MSEPIVAAPNATPTVPSATPEPIKVSNAGVNTPSAPADWTSNLSDELKGYVQMREFKDPGAVVDSYRNLEKLLGVPKERVLKLPEKADDPAWNEIYGRLGRPEKADDYKIQMPKEGGSEEFAKWAKSAFHELGLSNTQAEKLSGKWNEFVNGNTQKAQEANAQMAKEAEANLRKEWGMAFEKNFNIIDQAAEKLGLSNEQLVSLRKAMGPVDAAKFVYNLGTKVLEDNFVAGDQKSSGFGVMTPNAARSRLESLRQDNDFVTRYAAGDHSAREEMDRLHQMAYPSS